MTTTTPIDQAHWASRLTELVKKHGVPGAQLGILRVGRDGAADELVTAVTGVLHAGTGQPATDDSVWQIGSVSKVWTATVVMQLVDEGKFTLDTPVVEILPELALGDPEVTKTVTVWHLLTHTSGIDGDVFTDTGGATTAWRSTSLRSATRRRTTRSGPRGPTATPASACSAGSSRSAPA